MSDSVAPAATPWTSLALRWLVKEVPDFAAQILEAMSKTAAARKIGRLGSAIREADQCSETQ